MQSTLAKYVPLIRYGDSLSGLLLSLISAVFESIVSQFSGSETLAYLHQKEPTSQLSFYIGREDDNIVHVSYLSTDLTFSATFPVSSSIAG